MSSRAFIVLKFLEAEKVMNKKLISYVFEIKMFGA